MIEIFKDIKDYPNYQISNYGNVKSLKYNEPRILKPATGMKGYLYVNICDFNKKYKKHYIHRLVASTFIRGIKKDEQIDHKDSNKINNMLENLDIVDNRINQLRNKKGILPGVSKIGNKWRTRIQLNKQIIPIGTFNTPEEAHEAYKNKLKEYGINIDFSQDLACVLDDYKV
jgi:hypothetical protein